MANPPAIGRQLDRCDVCGIKIHRKDLVRTQMRYMRPEGENHFAYSSYDGSYWVTNGTSEGNLSSGPEGDKERAQVNDTTVTAINGSPTFSGNNKYFRSATSVDVSGFTSWLFSAEVGPHFDTQAEMTITLGYCDSDGSNPKVQKTFVTRTGKLVWCKVNVADMTAGYDTSNTYFFINITGLAATDKYYIDWLQLEKNRDTVGPYFRTSGTAQTTRVLDVKMMTAPKVCPSCKEVLLKESEQYGRPYSEFELPVPMDAQEV